MRSLARPARLFLAALLLSLATVRPAAAATDYTDIWWAGPAESGWGVNFIQSNNFIFATFFIYTTNGDPGWVSAQLSRSGNVWTGPLYVTQGTFFGAPWNPADGNVIAAGVATFTAVSSTQGTLTYNVGNIVVTKTIARQTLTPIPLDGAYVGGASVTVTSCSNPGGNGSATGAATVEATLAPDGTLKLDLTVKIGNTMEVFTVSGASVQQGTLHRVPSAVIKPNNAPALAGTASQIKRTATGIEGLFSLTLGNGCQQAWAFSAVQATP